ncbi:MAG: hypothetical protein EP343_17400 [Deltaproteobacteria bacterium]|nr:MAG: hypothetical protein EP343_17400 [Deltaproteobacteria bacterium]
MKQTHKTQRQAVTVPARWLWSLLLLAGITMGCSPIQRSYLRNDYAKVDRFKVKRLKVTVAPLPQQRADLGKLWVEITSTHISQKKNFLLKETASLKAAGVLQDHCQKGIEGWLHLQPTVTQKGAEVEAAVVATLVRCRDGKTVWSTTAKGTWASKDDHLKVLTQSYVQKLGKPVEPFVAPSCRLLFVVIENLPNPKLSEADLLEKIQSGG